MNFSFSEEEIQFRNDVDAFCPAGAPGGLD
jgi:hypothetical protein